MELRHIRYFVAVAEERHFGRAARRLHIAQPPLSRQIQALEAELGFALFERSRRKVEITTGGEILLQHARHVFEALELGVREARRAASGQLGRLAIGYPASLAYSGLTELLRAFRERASGVEIILREMPPQDQVDALRERRIDVGFVRALDDPTLAYEHVRSEPLVVALSADHPLAGRRRIPLPLLAREPFVCFPRSRGPAFFDVIMRLCADAGFTPRIAHEAPQLDMVSLVAAGFGVAIVPESVRGVRRAGVVLRPIVGSPRTELLVAWRADDRSPVLRDFVELVRKLAVAWRKRTPRD